MTIVARFAVAAMLAGVAVTTAAPALADEKLPVPAYKGWYDARHDKFCLQLTGNDAQQTGTRIVPAECKTQAQWAAQGLKVARN